MAACGLTRQVEARWQQLVQLYPGVGQYEFDWCTGGDFDRNFNDYAQLLGGVEPTECRTHSHTLPGIKSTFTDSVIAAKDAEYLQLMGLMQTVNGVTSLTQNGMRVRAV
jgi:hypothetical protein